MAIILRIGAWLRTNISHQGAIYVHGGVVARLPAHRHGRRDRTGWTDGDTDEVKKFRETTPAPIGELVFRLEQQRDLEHDRCNPSFYAYRAVYEEEATEAGKTGLRSN